MQRRTIRVIFLASAFLLACLPTAYLGTQPKPTAAATSAPWLFVTLTPTLEGRVANAQCVVISANEALHLRMDANPESRILAYMGRGEVVKLLSTSNADWWLVRRGEQVGYARSKYLKKGGC